MTVELQIASFHIGEFRALSNLTLQGSAQLNLLVGGNNSGKTSILEALAVFAAPLDLAEWSYIARMREVRSLTSAFSDALSAIDAIRWLFPQRSGGPEVADGAYHLRLAGEGLWKVTELEATCLAIRGIPPEPKQPRLFGRAKTAEQDGLMEDEGWRIVAKIEGASLFPEGFSTDLWPSVGFSRPTARSQPRLPTVLLAPYSHRNQPLQLRQLSRATESGDRLHIIEMLRQIDNDVLGLDILTDSISNRPRLTVRHRQAGVVPIGVLGDGFRRAVSIALSLVQAKAGLILIDEIETALHVSTLNTLFPWLLRAVTDLDIQLFATTHSLEAVQAIVSAMPEDSRDLVAAFHLSSPYDPNRPRAKRYSADMLVSLVRDRGLDIR
jgi:hypothetical protein